MKAGVSENNIEFTELFGDSVDGAFSRFEIWLTAFPILLVRRVAARPGRGFYSHEDSP